METSRKEIIDFIDHCLALNPNQMYAVESAQQEFGLSQEEIAEIYQAQRFKEKK